MLSMTVTPDRPDDPPDDLPAGALAPFPGELLTLPVLEAARELLGRLLVTDGPEGPAAVRLVEVEAYAGGDDPASHSYRGRTARNAVMFGPPGHLYAYFTYGMHWCVNVVCAPEGTPHAVLLRAGQPVLGADLMAKRRRTTRERDLARGPARLAQALGLDGTASGADLLDGGPIRLTAGWPVPDDAVAWTPRVGITRAADRPWRALDATSPWVSPPRPRPAPEAPE